MGIVLEVLGRRKDQFAHTGDLEVPFRGTLKAKDVYPDGKCFWYKVKNENKGIIEMPETCLNTKEEELKAIGRIFFDREI